MIFWEVYVWPLYTTAWRLFLGNILHFLYVWFLWLIFQTEFRNLYVVPAFENFVWRWWAVRAAHISSQLCCFRYLVSFQLHSIRTQPARNGVKLCARIKSTGCVCRIFGSNTISCQHENKWIVVKRSLVGNMRPTPVQHIFILTSQELLNSVWHAPSRTSQDVEAIQRRTSMKLRVLLKAGSTKIPNVLNLLLTDATFSICSPLKTDFQM